MKCEVLLYSGVANLSFELTEDERAKFLAMFGKLEITGKKPPSRLGYRGFHLYDGEGNAQGLVYYNVVNGAASLNNSDWLVDDEGIEMFLLRLARKRFPIREAHPGLYTEPVFTKVTEFIGSSSGDYECFCFDLRTDKKRLEDMENTSMDAYKAHAAARIYPNDLLPPGTDYNCAEMSTPRGKWRITVEFTPEE